MTSNNINNIFSLFCEGKKLALYNKKPFLDADVCPDIEQRDTIHFSNLAKKYDMVILEGLGKNSEILNLLGKIKENGCIVILFKNKTLKEKLCIAFRLLFLNLYAKKWRLKTRGYFLLPNDINPTQLVSCQKYLAQQYFRKYYHWQYNEKFNKNKRFFRHLLYMLNAFYMNENNFLFWISKNAK